ncbi:MAG: hypothetical protein ACRD0M_07400 [Acidimicrobiales bacterium]
MGIQSATVFDPPPASTAGAQLNAGGAGNEGPSETVGRTDGPSRAGAALVPVASVLPRYAAEATRALETLSLPPSLRALVRAYFDGLAQQANRP